MNDDGPAIVFAVVILVIATAIFSHHLGYTDAEKEIRVQAIERNVAHWETDTKGNTKFVWNNEVVKPSKCGD